jgi:MFS transporter, DHA2 family, multidrug resistance protein
MSHEEHIAGRREWIGLAVIALPCLVYAMDLTALNLGVPTLARDLRPTGVELTWITDIYGFMVAGLLVTMGTLGDRIGRRRLLLIGSAAFAAASLLAAFSTSAEMLIASRALLGVAGSTLAPSTLALIRSMFLDERQRTAAIGVWITSFSAGGAIGPVVGGALLQEFWWGSVFLLALPVMAILLVVGPRLLPEFRDPDAGRLDLRSAALSLVAVLGLVYGFKQLAQHGLDPLAAGAIALGAAVGVVFWRRQRTLADPIVDPRLFRVPAFNAALSANTIGFFAAFGISVFVDQYLQLVLGLSPLAAGLWTVPSAAGFIVGSMVTPVIVRWMRPGLVIAGGLAVAAGGFAVLGQVGAADGLAAVVAGSAIFSLGLSAVFTLAADVMVGSAPPERAGAASALSETSSELGGALGLAILGTVGAAVYRSHITIPGGVPRSAAAAARETLGGAVSTGHGLPRPIGSALVASASDAFTHAFEAAAAVTGGLVFVAAVAAVVLLRRASDAPEAAPAAVAPAPCN